LNALMSDGRLPARRRWVGWVIGLIIVALVLAIGWVVIRGFSAASELQAVRGSLAQMQTAIDENDFGRAEQTAPRIADHAALARDLTSDPVWRGFELIPWLGGDFTALREVAEITDEIAVDAVAPLVGAMREADLATLGLNGAHVDLAPLTALQGPLDTSAALLAAADLRAQRIEPDAVIPALADAVTGARDLIHEASAEVGGMHGASVLLPGMLGGNGPRTYLIAVQNNTELRAGGGAVQALLVMHADSGSLSIERTATGREIPEIEDATSAPGFAGAAEAIAQRWQQQYGGTIDGVIAVDVIALQHLIAATGAVSFGEFTANADTLVSILGSDIPSTIDDVSARDALTVEASAALLSAAFVSDDPAAIIGALSDAASDDRIRIWSVHTDEQARLAASALGGTIPSDRPDQASVGVLLDDRTGGAMDYYADAAISTAVGLCHGDPTTQVRVTWTNDAPSGDLPPAVTGETDLEAGDIRTLITIYGPEGATAREPGDTRTSLGTRDATQSDVTLSPGESTTITATFTGSGADRPFVRVEHTPMLSPVDISRADVECW